MMQPQTVHNHNSYTTITQSLRPCFVSGNNGSYNYSTANSPAINFGKKVKKNNVIGTSRRRGSRNAVKAIFETDTETDISAEPTTQVKVTVTVTPALGGVMGAITKGLDDLTDAFGKGVLLELVAAEVDPKSGEEKETLKAFAKLGHFSREAVEYKAEFEVSDDFGIVGGILVENEHHTEMFIHDIVLDGSKFTADPITFSCQSWVSPKEKRIFFSTKNRPVEIRREFNEWLLSAKVIKSNDLPSKASHLPSETPNGLMKHRKKELEMLRGDGTGERKKCDRIYDYDVYNDLGDPDANETLARPIFGGNKTFPYPRRCRTGRHKTKTDPLTESRSRDVYVPRDELFSAVKDAQFSANTFFSVMHVIAPSIKLALKDREMGFLHFTSIDSLFSEGIHLANINKSMMNVIPSIIKAVEDTKNHVLLFETPKFLSRDKFGWMRDVEFSRQTLAGLNPCNITLVTEWPPMSKLDPEVYGPAESAITTEFIEEQIKGFATLDEALKQKKLFMIDYHDILLPYVEKVRSQKGTTLYGSRAMFFLTPESGTLMPVAIELVRPPMDGKPQWKEAYKPCWTATGSWLWKLAKAHFLAHDSGIHQLVSHWLRTHACTEPYIIATRRQLSEMHPIYRLLHPHFRYTMEINALARAYLINAHGIIEGAFTPLKYSMEICSTAYDKHWRFDQQALPADLISRGMAEPDYREPHGLKLAIEDYPYANDGLILWDILKKWVTDYVTHYYPDEKSVQSDEELQQWWTEIRTVGHADKKDEPWWPVLNTPTDLIGILTTIVWVTSGQHAAVNFGQYDFAGYFPNRPTIARTTMPTEDPSDERWELFLRRPELELLNCFPSQTQATIIMAILHILSTHSPDEDYIGENTEPAWEKDPVIKAAFLEFSGRLKELEGIIDARNTNEKLSNRTGAGVLPYQLLKPFSEPGCTAQGVPYSISI